MSLMLLTGSAYDHHGCTVCTRFCQKYGGHGIATAISVGEQVVVQRSTNDIYAALIENKLCVKVGYGNWSPGEAGVQVCCHTRKPVAESGLLSDAPATGVASVSAGRSVESDY